MLIRLGTARCAVALVLMTGLTTAALGPLAPSSAAPVSPAPTGVQTGTTDDDVLLDVDVHEGVVTAVGRTSPPDSGGSEAFVLTVRPGQAPERTVIPADVMDDVAAVDAGPWGAVVVGSTSADPAEGGWDLVARRYGADGSVLWTTTLAGSASDLPGDLVVDGDTVYVAGDSSSPGQGRGFLVATLDLATGAEQGRRVWAGGPWSSLTDLAVSDGLLVAGGFAQHAAEGPFLGLSDAVVVGLDAETLTTRWSAQFGTVGQDYVGGVAIDGDAVYVASRRAREPVGMVVSRLRLDGSPVWNRAKPDGDGLADPTDLVVDDGGPVVVGSVTGRLDSTQGSAETADAFAQGLDPATGAVRWTSRVGGADSVEVYRAAAPVDGRVVAAGWTSGDIFGPSAGGRDAAVAVVAPPSPPVPVRRAVRADVRPAGVVRVRAGTSRTATVTLRNAGSATDAVRAGLSCKLRPGIRVAVRQGRRDVTALVLRGRYRTPALAAGRTQLLSVRVTAGRSAAARASTCTVRAFSVAAPPRADKAQIRVVVVRRR